MFKNDKVETQFNSNTTKNKQLENMKPVQKNLESMLEELKPQTLKSFTKMVTNIRHGK